MVTDLSETKPRDHPGGLTVPSITSLDVNTTLGVLEFPPVLLYELPCGNALSSTTFIHQLSPTVTTMVSLTFQDSLRTNDG